MYLKGFTDLDFFFYFFNLPCHFRKEDVALSAANLFVSSETNKHNDFNQFWKFKLYFRLLILTDPVIICIYLRTTDRYFRDQGNGRHPSSMWFGPNI